MNNPYWKNICAIAERQRAKGISTYGQGIEMNPADVITRIEYLQEELVDALMYCEWIKDRIRGSGKWIPVTERLPETDDFVLVIVSGQYENIRLEQAIEFANYNKDEGWILEMWPEWDNPNVTYWMQVPERPEV